MDEIYESNCLETLEQYGFSNLTETFLTVAILKKVDLISKMRKKELLLLLLVKTDTKKLSDCSWIILKEST